MMVPEVPEPYGRTFAEQNTYEDASTLNMLAVILSTQVRWPHLHFRWYFCLIVRWEFR